MLPLLSLVWLILACSPEVDYEIAYKYADEKEVNNTIDGIQYTSGNWQEITYENAETSLGNHRAVVQGPDGTDAVKLHIPWRRRDIKLLQNRVIIINANSQDTVKNLIIREYNSEYADIIFQTSIDGGVYHVYYYPFSTTGSYYPIVKYLTPKITANNDWLENYKGLNS